MDPDTGEIIDGFHAWNKSLTKKEMRKAMRKIRKGMCDCNICRRFEMLPSDKIIPVTLADIEPIKEEATAAGILFSENCQYWGYFREGNLVAICGVLFRRWSVVFKCDYTVPAYRGQGIFTKLNHFRLEMIRKKNMSRILVDRLPLQITANCTPVALSIHIQAGAEVVNMYKNGIVKVVYKNNL